jgi:DNA-binding transcriptional LysR family regulator
VNLRSIDLNLLVTFEAVMSERSAEGMEPTPRALQIASVVSDALGQIEQVVDEETAFDPLRSERRFTVRVSEYVAPFLLPALCATVRREAPGITLQVAHFDARETDQRIGPDEIHVRATSLTPPPAASAGLRLIEDVFVVLMSRTHPQARRSMTLDRYIELAHLKVAAAALGTNMIDDALSSRDYAGT